jgi:hypothetical protein
MTIEQQLRAKIKEVLDTVTKANSPKVFNMIQSELGYKVVEASIIVKMSLENITASACIPHLEGEM